MNLLRRSINLLSTSIYSHICPSSRSIASPVFSKSQLAAGPSWAAPGCGSWIQGLVSRGMATLYQMHRTGPHIKKRKSKNPLGGKPFAKGVILKTLIRKPKKPNSANRKCVLVRLSSGKEMTAYVPGIGHNLQEHQIVLVRPGRLQDTPGVKLKCVRGKYDLPHVMKQTQ